MFTRRRIRCGRRWNAPEVHGVGTILGTVTKKRLQAKRLQPPELHENTRDKWSGRVDSNHRPPGPEPGALARLSHAPKGALFCPAYSYFVIGSQRWSLWRRMNPPNPAPPNIPSFQAYVDDRCYLKNVSAKPWNGTKMPGRPLDRTLSQFLRLAPV